MDAVSPSQHAAPFFCGDAPVTGVEAANAFGASGPVGGATLTSMSNRGFHRRRLLSQIAMIFLPR
jgi:hypothetical protein